VSATDLSPLPGSREFEDQKRAFEAAVPLPAPITTDYEDYPEAQGLERDRVWTARLRANGSEPPADDRAKAPTAPPIDWAECTGEPPPRTWWIQDWLTPAPTLCAGAGGIGKSLLLQAIATSLSTGCEYIEAATKPLRVLVWFCEDDKDEIWRRQAAMNAHFRLEMADLDRLHIVPRLGLDNTLLDLVYSKPTFTPLQLELREQVNDLRADVLVLDNIAQTYGGNFGDNHQVTLFVNGIHGLVTDRPFAPVFLGHVAKGAGSEFSGPMAWENACRMRWYLGAQLPDQKPDDDEPGDPETVYLAKRKANYAAKDYRRLRYCKGLLVPENAASDRLDTHYSNDLAERIALKGFRKLKEAGIHTTDGKTSPDYLPKQIVAKGFAEGHRKGELAAAVNRLIGAGKLKRGVIGKYANRAERFGLIEVLS